jgi:VanZ family protein
MTVKAQNFFEHFGPANFCYFWLPPMLLTAGILFMAGDAGSVFKVRLPIFIIKYLLPSLPDKEVYQLYLGIRKVGHFLAYAALFGAYVRAWRWHNQISRLKAVFLALGICFLVSVADEGRQMFYASRSGSPKDVGLDMSGALTAAIALFPFLRQDNSKK